MDTGTGLLLSSPHSRTGSWPCCMSVHFRRSRQAGACIRSGSNTCSCRTCSCTCVCTVEASGHTRSDPPEEPPAAAGPWWEQRQGGNCPTEAWGGLHSPALPGCRFFQYSRGDTCTCWARHSLHACIRADTAVGSVPRSAASSPSSSRCGRRNGTGHWTRPSAWATFHQILLPPRASKSTTTPTSATSPCAPRNQTHALCINPTVPTALPALQTDSSASQRHRGRGSAAHRESTGRRDALLSLQEFIRSVRGERNTERERERERPRGGLR